MTIGLIQAGSREPVATFQGDPGPMRSTYTSGKGAGRKGGKRTETAQRLPQSHCVLHTMERV